MIQGDDEQNARIAIRFSTKEIFSHIKEFCPADLESSNADNGPAIYVSDPSTGRASIQFSSHYFHPLLKETTQKIHELLLKSLISSNVPFTYLENHYFQEYQSEITRCIYSLSRWAQIIEKVLPTVHARHEL
ncbi:hypothetical protein VP01_3749g1 [Puccinia sorghi]|uniref:Uncharacterized protein n=1 Tax=Puccinia sorghi TaxID=27349 RepID=A0A0L6UTV1_9BASI|nr:hypothetical protein VP01_3749g1 [Puccinia sorghi]